MGDLIRRGRTVPLTRPRPIDAGDNLSQFDCGEESLNEWLRQRALASEGISARTYVVRDGRLVVGYYCLATGGVARANMPRKIRHGLPDPVPVMLLGRLAVDRAYRSKGIGGGLLVDTFQRTLQVSAEVGVRAVVVHAIDDEAHAFYTRYGFVEFPPSSRTLFMPLEWAAKAL